MKQIFEKEYTKHKIFKELKEILRFYNNLSISTMSFLQLGLRAIINIDTYVYTSIQGTLESIKVILHNGRINDAYALLRKYYDSSIINVYTNLFLEDKFSIENRIVKEINNWVNGTEKLPDYRIMSDYIQKSPKLLEITKLLKKDESYKDIRQRCNDHTHYNFFHNMSSNDNAIHLKENRIIMLNNFSSDLTAIFIQHLAYLFFLKNIYMMSSDYIDSLECGLEPIKDSEYFVAPFIQGVFDRWIKTNRPDIVEIIKLNTKMFLE